MGLRELIEDTIDLIRFIIGIDWHEPPEWGCGLIVIAGALMPFAATGLFLWLSQQ
jgi:hypothetical protein